MKESWVFRVLSRAVTAAALLWILYAGLLQFYPSPLCYVGVGGACAEASMRALEAEPPDDAAFALAERGCQRGHATSCNNLGVCYQRGTGTKVDLVRARETYAQACSLADGGACQNQAELLFDGKGGPADEPTATRLLERACGLGRALSCRWLMGMNQGERALHYARKGCALEDTRSCGMAALLLAQAEPRSAELRDRIGDLNKRCANDEAPACGALTLLYSAGVGVEHDLGRAKALADRTCALGVTQACKVKEQPEILETFSAQFATLVTLAVEGNARNQPAK